MILRSILLNCYIWFGLKLIFIISEWVKQRYSSLSSKTFRKWYCCSFVELKLLIVCIKRIFFGRRHFRCIRIFLWFRTGSKSFCRNLQRYIFKGYQNRTVSLESVTPVWRILSVTSGLDLFGIRVTEVCCVCGWKPVKKLCFGSYKQVFQRPKTCSIDSFAGNAPVIILRLISCFEIVSALIWSN